MSNQSSSPTLTNCSFQTNTANNNGWGMFNGISSNPSLTNCVLFGNGGSKTIITVGGSSLSASYSLFENEVTDFTDNGNNLTGVTISPFASTTSTQLSACAPAINAGNPASLTAATGPYSATALPQTDLAGNPRIVGNRVDMGAYEFQGTPAQPVVITAQPAAGSAVCAGGSVTTSVSVSGTTSAYQWYNALGAVAGQTSATLTLSNLQASQAGSYSVVVTGACNSVTSTAFSLTVNPLPTASISGNLTVCSGQSTTLTASGGTTYLWNTGATTASISATAGAYSVTVSSGSCSANTSATVTASPALVASISGNLTVCSGQSTTLTASGGTTYLWNTGATTASISATAGAYSVTVSTGTCSATTSATVTANPALVASISGNLTVCSVKAPPSPLAGARPTCGARARPRPAFPLPPGLIRSPFQVAVAQLRPVPPLRPTQPL